MCGRDKKETYDVTSCQNNEFNVLECGSGLIPEPLIINWVDFSPTLRVPYMKFCSLSKSQCDI